MPRKILEFVPDTTSQMKRLHLLFNSAMTGITVPKPRFREIL